MIGFIPACKSGGVSLRDGGVCGPGDLCDDGVGGARRRPHLQRVVERLLPDEVASPAGG